VPNWLRLAPPVSYACDRLGHEILVVVSLRSTDWNSARFLETPTGRITPARMGVLHVHDKTVCA
jgi:hypothetical protein